MTDEKKKPKTLLERMAAVQKNMDAVSGQPKLEAPTYPNLDGLPSAAELIRRQDAKLPPNILFDVLVMDNHIRAYGASRPELLPKDYGDENTQSAHRKFGFRRESVDAYKRLMNCTAVLPPIYIVGPAQDTSSATKTLRDKIL